MQKGSINAALNLLTNNMGHGVHGSITMLAAILTAIFASENIFRFLELLSTKFFLTRF